MPIRRIIVSLLAFIANTFLVIASLSVLLATVFFTVSMVIFLPTWFIEDIFRIFLAIFGLESITAFDALLIAIVLMVGTLLFALLGYGIVEFGERVETE